MEKYPKRKRGRLIGRRLTLDGKRLKEVDSERLAQEIAEGSPYSTAYWSELARRGIRRSNVLDQGFAIDLHQLGQQ